MGLDAYRSLSVPGKATMRPQDSVTTAATAPGTGFFKHQAEKGDDFSCFLTGSREGCFSVAVQGRDTDFLKTQLEPVGILLDFENTVKEL